MTESEPSADLCRQLFGCLIGDATVDAAAIREFCNQHGVTPAQVMREMLARRQSAHQKEADKANVNLPEYPNPTRPT